MPWTLWRSIPPSPRPRLKQVGVEAHPFHPTESNNIVTEERVSQAYTNVTQLYFSENEIFPKPYAIIVLEIF
jgi:hypothetical protein